MNTKTALAALLASASLTAYAGDIDLKSCPAAVQQTIQANSRDGKLDEIDVIKIEDRTLYVADVDLPGDKDLKIHVSGEGKLLKTREDVAASELPPAVAGAVDKLAAAGGRLDDVDKEVADGKTTYHVEIDRSGSADLKAVVAEDGAVLSQAEEVND